MAGGLPKEASSAIVLLVGLGAITFVTLFWAVIGLVLSVFPALYFHDWSMLGIGAGAGAALGLLICVVNGTKGFIKGRIARGIRKASL